MQSITSLPIIPPLRAIDGYAGVPIQERNEPLVQLSENKNILLDYTYFKDHLNGAEAVCYVRKSVAQKLSAAAKSLPANYHLQVNDGWRSYSVQLSIYKMMYDSIKRQFPNYSEDELHQEASKFASSGSLDPLCPSPHFTGGAVDVTLIDSNGEECYMGTDFDESTAASATRFLEEKLERSEQLTEQENIALKNRRLLFYITASAGFTNYSNEWWHFDYGNQLWAKIVRSTAFYGLIAP